MSPPPVQSNSKSHRLTKADQAFSLWKLGRARAPTCDSGSDKIRLDLKLRIGGPRVGKIGLVKTQVNRNLNGKQGGIKIRKDRNERPSVKRESRTQGKGLEDKVIVENWRSKKLQTEVTSKTQIQTSVSRILQEQKQEFGFPKLLSKNNMGKLISLIKYQETIVPKALSARKQARQ